MDFKNQVVLVTGGTRGIGRGIVHAFAKEGACIAVNGTKKQLCSAVVEEVREYGGQGIAVPGDISKSEDVQKVFAQIFEQIGHLDILVNNAGVIYVVECTDTQALAMELALHGVNVNAVCPGIVDTDMMKEELVVLEKLEGKSEKELRRLFLDMIPLGRYESTDDIASLVLFLASEKAQYITGQSINVSGGIEFH
jgi:NAD(P)-dependent dehydrogenase (short-subunit alcohol dehydrogenase family)